MKKEDFALLLGDLDDKYIANARNPSVKAKHRGVYGAVALCLCLTLFIIPPAFDKSKSSVFVADNNSSTVQAAGEKTVEVTGTSKATQDYYMDSDMGNAAPEAVMESVENDVIYISGIPYERTDESIPTDIDSLREIDISNSYGYKIYEYGEKLIVEIDEILWVYQPVYEEEERGQSLSS